ncbi:MAG: 30S ribosomal protein S7 [bacterium]|jgi:small subunit ribosomal protein S7|nr:30S ribosomal protein S7 [bacterium]MCZ6700623.1 30S ribosomal protein S7 [bacterium]MDV2478963.1 30S ribosomal protein S7 [bacterium]
MPRRREVPKRPVLPDPIYHDTLVTEFINSLMRKGKKSLAERILYGSFELIRGRTGEDPLPVFKRAVENIKPSLEVKSRRVGGSTYQIPVEVRPSRRMTLAIRWLILHARERSERTMQDRLAAELLDASNRTGLSWKKREDTHKMAEANKAFAHYRW